MNPHRQLTVAPGRLQDCQADRRGRLLDVSLVEPRIPWQLMTRTCADPQIRVYQAVHPGNHRVAACKVVTITPDFSEWQMKSIDKECRVHSALKHKHILELIGAAKLSIEQAARGGYLPAFYLLMEMAAGGDLFDKIGETILRWLAATRLMTVHSTRCWNKRGHCTLLLLSNDCWSGTFQDQPGAFKS